jgi:imidazoleglycerol-phosphate dehydratase
MSRTAEIHRQTKETDIRVKLDLDGDGESSISTGIGFFDHMLNQLSRHSLIDLLINASGDLEIDPHHTVEDVGIALGQALDKALGAKEGIHRYGSAIVPMDEALIMAAIDFSGRGHLEYAIDIPAEMVGELPADLVLEFFTSLARNAKMTIHLRQLSGENPHHIVEATFKSFAHALREAVSKDERVKGVPSTKGSL